MKEFIKITGILMLVALVSTSCSKQKYTASFAPSKQKRWVELEKPAVAKSDLITEEDATVSSEPIAAPVVQLDVVKEIDPIKERAPIQSFTKTEIKQVRKQLRKEVFKQVKHNLLHSKKSALKPQNQDKTLEIILCFFIPPLAVYLYQDRITNDFWLDLVLLFTLFGSVIYALLVVLDVVTIA